MIKFKPKQYPKVKTCKKCKVVYKLHFSVENNLCRKCIDNNKNA